MTAVERTAREVLAAAWRWNVAQTQSILDRHAAELWLSACVVTHGNAVKRSIARRLAAARRAKKL